MYMLDIKKAMKRRGITINDLASKIGISRVVLSGQINGNPTLSNINRIAEAIGCDISELFRKEETGEVSGYIETEGKIQKITSVEDLEKIIKEIKKQ